MLPNTTPANGRERVLTVLDIGSTKIICLIVALSEDAHLKQAPGRAIPARMLGVGQYRARGIKAGVVVDLAEAEAAIRGAVERAEAMAGMTVEDVVLSVSCGRIRSANFAANAEIQGNLIGDADIARVMAAGRAFAEREGRTLLQLHRLGYRLDGQVGIANPRGMAGQKLSVDLHAVTSDEGPVRNLMMLLKRCLLNVDGLVSTPYASGLATITEEEAQLGVVSVDLGGGTTKFSVFAEGHFLHTDAVAIGGNHISFDIARSLSTPLYEAERIKTVYGTLVGASSDERETISYPVAGEDDVLGFHVTTRSQLRKIIKPRVEEILQQVQDRLERSGFADFAGSRVVLTGGASQLTGVAEFAARSMGKSVRIGRPRTVSGMPESLATPAFATAIGLVHAVLVPGAAVRAYEEKSVLRAGGGYLDRVGEWFMKSFWDEPEAH